jgi:LmbE family N-acetylglucosaminyl deacetylase
VSATVVLSPHFDDAVLSCWHLLHSDADVSVVNIFTGAPENGQPPGWWDLLTGATSAAERLRERAVEDRGALGVAGRDAVCLDLLDEQHRTEPLAPEPLVDLLRSSIPAGSRVVAPAALGGHADHALARDAGLRLTEDGYELELYADLPGASRYGWPTWVTGDEPDRHVDVDAYWHWLFAEAGLDPDGLRPRVHRLHGPQHVLKREALRHYRTQLPALRGLAPLDDPVALGYEVTWTLDATASRRTGC